MYKKQVSIILASCMIFTSLIGTGSSVYASETAINSTTGDRIQAEFFVSPSGSDTNDGSYDHPFATLQAARDAVRLINSDMKGDIYVFIAAGNYYVNNTISFNESDSGTNGFNIIYRNLDELGSAKFIGGNKVTSAWNVVSRTGADADLPVSADGSVYKTFVGTGVNFNTLYVNDERAVMARTKNLNRYPGFPASSSEYMKAMGGSISSLIYKSTNSQYIKAKAVDNSTNTEWVSNSEDNPWIQLGWSSSQTVNKVTLHDRVNTTDWIKGGTMTFSDGSSIDVTGIPNDGSAKDVTFPDKTITWVKFQVTGSSGNNGLSEFKAWNTSNVNISPNAAVTVSSEYGVGNSLDAVSEAGLVNAQARGELDAQVYIWDWDYRDWMTDTIPLASINTSTGAINFKTTAGHPEAYRPHFAIGAAARFVLQGNLGFLDQPGEYYFNKTTGYLYYYPKSGTGDISSQDIVIPKLEKIIEVKGSSRTSPASNITFDGLQIKDTNFPDYYSFAWNYGDVYGMGIYPPEAQVVGVKQPSYSEQTERVEFQTGALQLTNTNHITITNAHVLNAGMMGINVYLANQYTNINNSLIEGIGNNGIQLEGGYPGLGGDSQGNGYNSYNTITNTIVRNIGELVGSASGITIMNSGYNTLSHLEVYNSSRRGIFLSGGYSRNPNYPAPDGNPSTIDGDRDYDPMTDLYAHHNTFEYIYLHDNQQDGGDDGSFFACFLYRGPTNRPNYINQMLIGSTGANPSMADIAPNNMNLDMGTSGFEISNFKSVNPQHYNAEIGGGDSRYVLTNTNIDFGTAYNQLATFNDSLMDYAHIGVGVDFPSVFLPAKTLVQEPNNIYFKENFENGLNFSKWSYKGKAPDVTKEWMSEDALSGKQALKIDSDSAVSGFKPVLYRNFSTNLNKIVTVKLFDRQNNSLAPYDSGAPISTTVKSLARVDNGSNTVGLGLDTTVSGSYYVMLNDSTETATSVRRTYGWHELKWDYTSETDVKLYIDGILVNTLNTSTNFNHVDLGSDDGKGVSYYDQLYIYGGKDAPSPGSIPIPVIPAYDSSNDNVIQLDKNFADGVVPTFNLYGGGTPPGTPVLSVIADPNNPSNKVLQEVIKDGNAFYQSGAPWNNYIVNLKWKFVGWGANNILNQQYDNFTIYVMTKEPNSSNPSAYQVIYRRNKLGVAGFPAGTPYFEISKHNPGDTSLGKVAVPSGFVETDWHNFEIQTYGGKVGFVVDGTKILSANDGAYTSGGVGFGGINATVMLDDIKITSNPTYVKYGTNFNLGNVNLNGTFNPGYTTYGATVIDNSQPVTLKRPLPVIAGASTAISLNGVDITASFPDYTTPTALNLLNGRNTLVISETTTAGTKNYTIYIDKVYSISSIGSIAPITTMLGTAPVLPSTTIVTFGDGSSQVATIIWDNVNPSSYKNNTGTFTVNGQLVGLEASVSTTVTVNGLESIGTLQPVSTVAGTAPVLAQSISAQFTNETKDLSLSFADLDPAMYAKPGTFIAVATADQYTGDVLQMVTVMPSTLTLSGITAPESITGVSNGTAKTAAALGLPTTVELVTDTAESLTASVAWNVDASSYDPSSHAGQTFTVNGTVTLPDGVANPNNVALTTSISVTVLPAPVSPHATLTSGQQVITGEALDLTMGLSNVTQTEFQRINAQELTLTYDAVSMQLGSVTSLVYGLQVIDQKEAVPGHVQIVLASTDPDGFASQGDLLKFSFTAKTVTQVTNTTFGVSNFTIANGLGNEMQINGASSSAQIILPAVPVDKTSLNDLITSAQAKHDAAVEGNMDGQYLTGSKAILQLAIDNASATAINPNATQVQVDNAKTALEAAVQAFENKIITADVNGNGTISIGDLAIVSSSYGKQPGQSGWNDKADVNKDGKVDITDLAIVAKAIIH